MAMFSKSYESHSDIQGKTIPQGRGYNREGPSSSSCQLTLFGWWDLQHALFAGLNWTDGDSWSIPVLNYAKKIVKKVARMVWSKLWMYHIEATGKVSIALS